MSLDHALLPTSRQRGGRPGRGAAEAGAASGRPAAAAQRLRPAGPACACGGGCPRCAAPGGALEPALRRRMEAALDAPLADVRIHTDRAAADFVAAQGAHALTLGRDVFFAPGRFAPHRSDGLRRLGHELVHVLQQRRGAGHAASGAAPAAEAEARALGAAAASGQRVQVRQRAAARAQADDAADATGGGASPPQLQLDPEIERLMLQHTLRWWLGNALVLGDAPTQLPPVTGAGLPFGTGAPNAAGPLLSGLPLRPDLFAPLPPDPFFLRPDAGALFAPFGERGAPVGPGDTDAVMQIYRRNAAIANQLPDLRSLAPRFVRPLIPTTWRRDIAGALTGAAVGASLKHDYATPIEVADRAFEAMTGASTTVVPLPSISFDLF